MPKPKSVNSTSESILSRREVAKIGALGMLGAALASTRGHAEEVTALDDAALQTLVERIVNSRYTVDAQGYLTLTGEIWSGDDGSLRHQDWLFNSADGLKTNAQSALAKSVGGGSETHSGAELGAAANAIDSIMSISDALGILGEDNLIYHALRVKMLHNWEHGFAAALEGFQQWITESDDMTEDVKALVGTKLDEFRTRPVGMTSHDW